MRHLHEELEDRLEALENRMEQLEVLMADQQAELDADTAAITQVATDLSASTVAIQAELDALKAGQVAGAPLDFTKLEAAVAALDTQAKTVGGLTPTPPAVTGPPNPQPPGPTG